MEHRRTHDRRPIPSDRSGKAAAVVIVGFLLSLMTVSLLSITTGMAASVPVWLDDAITMHNSENPDLPVEFVDIKNSFVWYMTARVDPAQHVRIRENVYGIARANGYKQTEQEELVTTGKPPSPTDPHSAKKCWKRNFILELETGRQRLLTTLVCEDESYWFAGFRTAG
jgi:hypothetical protein